jgi:spore coat protein CotH
VDLPRYTSYLAACAFIQHWDAYNKNHYILHDPTTKKWFMVPWDTDRTLGDHWDGAFDRANLPVLMGIKKYPGVTGWNRLQDRFFSEPRLKKMFLDRLDELLRTELTEEKLFPLIAANFSKSLPLYEQDRRKWGGPRGRLEDGVVELKTYIRERRAFLMKELESGKL